MLKFLNLQPEVFGIAIDDLSLRLVKIKKKQQGFSVTSFNEVYVQPGTVKEGAIQNQEALIKAIKLACSTVKGEKLGTKYIIASLPEEKSFSQVIQMPKMTQEELRSSVPFEAENYIPLPIDKVYLDFQIIDYHEKDNLNHFDILINAMPKYVIDTFVYCFGKSGLKPCVLEVESQSIARALIKNNQEVQSSLLIDLGVANTNLIIYSGRAVRFTSSLTISSKDLTIAVSKKLGINFDKAEELKIRYGLTKEGEKNFNIKETLKPILINLVSQIKKYVNFYGAHASHEYLLSDGKEYRKIEKIFLCGGGSNLKELPDFLSDELKMPVEIGNPLINLSGGKNNNQLIPQQKLLSFTTALGLALRGAANGEN